MDDENDEDEDEDDEDEDDDDDDDGDDDDDDEEEEDEVVFVLSPTHLRAGSPGPRLLTGEDLNVLCFPHGPTCI